jgi:organic radical activating enzyme
MNKPDIYPDKLTLDDLTKYFNVRGKAGDVVEITGGEPTLISWLEEFIGFLSDKGIRTVLKTNGKNLFKNVYDMVVVFNPHDESEEYAEARKALLKPTDIVLLKPDFTDKQIPDFKESEYQTMNYHKFRQMRFLTADGGIRTMCCIEKPTWNIWDMDDDTICETCPSCPFLVFAWNFAARLGKLLT